MKDIYNPMARFHPSNKIDDTAIIHDCVDIGQNNIIGPYTVIGSNGEIRGAKEFRGRVTIGDGNIISELVTIQRPQQASGATRIGDNNIIMAHTHIGHDVIIGNNCEICTGTIVGGYVRVGDNAKLKLGTTIRNRKNIGQDSLIGLGACVVKDVAPGVTVVGNPARELK